MLATQIDRECDLCTSSEIPVDLQNKGVCFYRALLRVIRKNGKHYLTWPCCAPFQPQTNIVYKNSKST